MNEFGKTAMRLASCGFLVFPCIPGGKRPITKRGFKDASKDPGVVEYWWTATPDANIGIPTGSVSGLFAVDLDEKNGKSGKASLSVLEKDHARLPDTYTVQTPSGGLHYYLQNFPNLKSTAGKLGPGIDTRGEGGYIIGPGSIIGGRPYEVIAEFPVAPMPDWLAGLLLKGGCSRPKKGTCRKKGSAIRPPAYLLSGISDITRLNLDNQTLASISAEHTIGERSGAFFNIVAAIYRAGGSFECIREAVLSNPSLSEKYEGRLDSEIARVLGKIETDHITFVRLGPQKGITVVDLGEECNE